MAMDSQKVRRGEREGDGSPPRVGSNAPRPHRGRGERSEDFPGPGRESNGILTRSYDRALLCISVEKERTAKLCSFKTVWSTPWTDR